MAERLNGPGFGVRMAMAGQVSTADVARQAIERLISHEEQLRELLSYCEQSAQNTMIWDPYEAFGDIATRLRAILDGEQ